MSLASNLRARLAGAPPLVVNVYALTAAFWTYFAMYAFRKPFSAGKYEGLHFFGTSIELKTAFVISQIIGYAASKYCGIKVCSESSRGRRTATLITLIAIAELALVAFAVVPTSWKFV